jgi:hypothetical protein
VALEPSEWLPVPANWIPETVKELLAKACEYITQEQHTNKGSVGDGKGGLRLRRSLDDLERGGLLEGSPTSNLEGTSAGQSQQGRFADNTRLGNGKGSTIVGDTNGSLEIKVGRLKLNSTNEESSREGSSSGADLGTANEGSLVQSAIKVQKRNTRSK